MNAYLDRALLDLPTPALVLDLDVLESNIRSMQERASSLGVRLRPHVKTHKCLEIARLQREAGAEGITVSTIEEARVFADHGFHDILWAFPLIPSRIDEVTELAERIRLGVTVDSHAAVEVLERSGANLSVWLEIDCGYGRSGIPHAGELVTRLARRVAGSEKLELQGCLTHAGHTYHAGSPERIAAIAEEERARMVSIGRRLGSEGISPFTLSVGSTPGMCRVGNLDGIDEARPGNYALFDYTQVRLGSCDLSQCAATVLSSVVSTSGNREHAIADCGALVLSKDLGPDEPPHYGRLFADLENRRLGSERVLSVSQEHGTVSGAHDIGDRVRILPNHSCLTTARFDHFDVVRRGRRIDRWKIWRARDREAIHGG